jgi:hypothetical protein
MPRATSVTSTAISGERLERAASAATAATAGGLAALYPGDVGIESNPNVVFVERFDEASTANLFGRWTDVSERPWMSIGSDAPAGSPVGKSLVISFSSTSTGGHLYRQLTAKRG